MSVYHQSFTEALLRAPIVARGCSAVRLHESYYAPAECVECGDALGFESVGGVCAGCIDRYGDVDDVSGERLTRAEVAARIAASDLVAAELRYEGSDGQWHYGRVTGCYLDADGVARVKYSSGYYDSSMSVAFARTVLA